jgi:hypothetical protein
VHASIWKFAGDPDDLLARYDAMVAEIPRHTWQAGSKARTQTAISTTAAAAVTTAAATATHRASWCM